ncbi:MAG: hypothetical protein M0036_05690 [Desulfobacteraceae bacterium]|nr:hypothetical protein [Desulfobacteraceae bacterium]
MKRVMISAIAILTIALTTVQAGKKGSGTLSQINEELLKEVQRIHRLSSEQIAAIRAIFARSNMIGQGNPAITQHPLTIAQCQERSAALPRSFDDPSFEKICGAKYMAPLFNPDSQKPEEAQVCIDQFEFPDIPCTYPLVWVRASEAAEICEAMGKRLCDAHEWEGACAGALEPPDYDFEMAKGKNPETAIEQMRKVHNRKRQADKSWSYGPVYQEGVCAAASIKNSGCDGGNWSRCGSNTYPSGSFPQCHSPLLVYDLNGNAAEHMNLPLNETEMASRGSKTLGYTEMKGSWFIFDTYRAHEDWCRWRAPFWHGSRVMDPNSHRNYHLGFRCCKTIQTKP